MALALHFLQHQFALIADVLAFLTLLTVIFDLAGYGAKDLLGRKHRPSTRPSVPEISVRREYREGLIKTEEIRFVGPEAVIRYENGFSKLLYCPKAWRRTCVSTDDLRQLLKQKIPHEGQTNNAPLQNGNNGRKQRVLDPNEAAGLINSGACEFVGNLPGGRVVVREM